MGRELAATEEDVHGVGGCVVGVLHGELELRLDDGGLPWLRGGGLMYGWGFTG